MRRGMKVRKTEAELQILNRGFHDKSLMPNPFYKQLMQAGFAYRNCILVTLFPDGETSCFGVIIRQDDLVFEIDLDLHDPEYSEWTDISEPFRNKALRLRDMKPWLKEVVAFKQFEAMRKERPVTGSSGPCITH